LHVFLLGFLHAVLVAVWRQGQKASTLDSGIKLALVNCAGTRKASWNDLSVLGDEIAQDIYIFVVNLNDTRHSESAKTLALEQQVLCGALWALVSLFKT
jgi:hypothetical protein